MLKSRKGEDAVAGVLAAKGKSVDTAGIVRTCQNLEDLAGRSRVVWVEGAQ